MPVALTALNKIANLLQGNGALQSQITSFAGRAGMPVPPITTPQIVVTSASPELADANIELTYPRVCLYATGVNNSLMEKFMSFSGTITVAIEIWASADLVTECDLWMHYYLGAVAKILEQNRGDWGDGFYFSGLYQAQIQSPKVGGLGFVRSAKLNCTVNASIA